MTPHLEQRLAEIAAEKGYHPASEYVHAMRLAAEAALEWQPIETAQVNRTVLLIYRNACGKWRKIIAVNASRFAIEVSEDCEGGEYREDNESYYLPAGWYERSDNNEDCQYFSVDDRAELVGWMPLPKEPSNERD